MANVTVSLDRAERLPRLCMVCGGKDCDFERVTIRPSVGAGGMVALANRQGYTTLTLTLPLCSEHRNHFAFQTILRYLGIATVIGVALFGTLLAAIINNGWLVGVVIAAVLAVTAAWFIISMTVNKSRVHVSGYTGDAVVFSNVSATFAQACAQKGGGGAPRAHDDVCGIRDAGRTAARSVRRWPLPTYRRSR